MTGFARMFFPDPLTPIPDSLMNIIEEYIESVHNQRQRTAEAEVQERLLNAARMHEGAAAWHLKAERLRCRPSVVLGAQLCRHAHPTTGEVFWSAEYNGLFVGGATPEEAFDNFDREFVYGGN
jgi:hypothetical protein